MEEKDSNYWNMTAKEFEISKVIFPISVFIITVISVICVIYRIDNHGYAWIEKPFSVKHELDEISVFTQYTAVICSSLLMSAHITLGFAKSYIKHQNNIWVWLILSSAVCGYLLSVPFIALLLYYLFYVIGSLFFIIFGAIFSILGA